MTGRAKAGSSRARGGVEALPSGALRVKVYAGIDPVTKKRHYLTETVAPGPKAERRAQDTRDRLLSEVRERRNPRTNATVDQLLERYLSQFEGSPNTLTLYRAYVRNHMSPFLGRLKVGDLDADVLDSFYAELRRCRTHCTGRRSTQHRVKGEHECNERCRPHACKPLGRTTTRHMHFILSGAYRKAVRWRWVSVNPISQADPPAAPKPNPQPPTSSEAARIVNEAWRDPDWGALIWTAMTTGARRGELAALRWEDIDLVAGRETVWLRRAVRKDEDGTLVEAELKSHQQRRVALDPETALVLEELRDRWIVRAKSLGLKIGPHTYLFSSAPDGSIFARPDGITQRYERLALRLDITTTFHKLRHYSATELITGGVDVRTVAGRLGHGGGGTTTLRTYTAWSSEADQRAATGLGSGMPSRPSELDEIERQQTAPRSPYEKIAAAIYQKVAAGELATGDALPPEKDLCAQFGVSVSTVRRATVLLRQWGVLGAEGRSVTAVPIRLADESLEQLDEPQERTDQYWSVVLRGSDGRRYPPRLVRATRADPESFRAHLVGIARLEAQASFLAGEQFELEIREPGASGDRPALFSIR